MKSLELYIHIPFCEKKCLYCDFVSFKATNEIIDKYIVKIIEEIKSKSFLANDYQITSIYIGGGTPSIIDPKYIIYILNCIFTNYHISDNCEISIEGNPNSLSQNKLKVYYDYGINRLSIGLQSANDNELKTLGRIHTYNDFLVAYNDSVHAGFKNINVDLINGIPQQTTESFRKSLKQVLMLGIKHISIYNLIIEDNTPFKRMLAENTIKLPLESELIKMDAITKELTEYYRLYRYEISNYAKNGYECKHNLGYWSDVPYIGFGLNASSYLNKTRAKNKSNINNYLCLDYANYTHSNRKSDYYDEFAFVCEKDHLNEYIMLSFRKISGININEFFNIFNIDFEDKFNNQINLYMNLNLLEKSDKNYYLSYKGLNVSNKIIADFMS